MRSPSSVARSFQSVGYGCEDAFPAAGVLETAATVLLELEEASRGLVLAVGLPVRWGKWHLRRECPPGQRPPCRSCRQAASGG